jgi:hypothetical protein
MSEHNEGIINYNGSITAKNIAGGPYATINETNNFNQKPPLAEAAAEIQQLLNQLQKTYPENIERAVSEEIKRNPSFRDRLSNAFKEGAIESLKQLFAPLNIPIEVVRGWVDAEPQPPKND